MEALLIIIWVVIGFTAKSYYHYEYEKRIGAVVLNGCAGLVLTFIAGILGIFSWYIIKKLYENME